MKVLSAMIGSLLITVTQALASGGGRDADSLSLLTIFFLGFGAVILVFQLIPAVILFGGIIKGLFSPAVKNVNETTGKHSRS